MTISNHELENRLWATADQLRANSELTSAEYKSPVLGLVFLRFVDQKFSAAKEQLEAQQGGSSRRTIGKADYQAQGVIFLAEEARYAHLLRLPEGADLGRAVSDAMEAIENENPELRGILPRDYSRVTNPTLATTNGIPKKPAPITVPVNVEIAVNNFLAILPSFLLVIYREKYF